MSLIYSRSPFFIQSTSGSTATVSLYVWNGNSSDVPTSAQYTLTKAHNSSGKATFEVSELIRDYVDQSFNGDYVTEAVWVYISMVDGAGTGVSGKYLATDGYIDEDFVQYWSKSGNNLKSDEVLMSNDYISVPEDTTAVIPTKDAEMAVFYKDGEVKYISELADKNLQDSDLSSWSPVSTTITYDYSVSPIGSSGSVLVDLSNQNGSRVSFNNSLTDGTRYTYSLHYKGTAGEKTYMYVLPQGGSAVAAGKLITFTGSWQREYVTFTAGNTNNYTYLFDTRQDSSTDASSFEVWGNQLEVGQTMTPYSAKDTESIGAINYATSAGQSASTFYARVMKDGGTIIDEKCSDDIMEYVSELDIDEAHIIKSDGKVEVVSVETLPCNKYENVRLTFVNKFGALQDIHFSAKTTESMTRKGEHYNSINFDYDNLSNNYGRHSVRNFNNNATIRHTLNTDYVHESYSEVFRQLIVSEQVWMEHKGAVKPVNVTTDSLQKKTHANNGLVQFTISVKESHSLINNIR
jgi:hypothetical protein